MAGEDRGGWRIVLLGAPGCGKGTQAARIASELKLPAIATGDMLRAAVAAGTELGSKVKDIMGAGELVSDALMADVVKARLAQKDVERGFLLDGYPRTMSQADTLDEVLEEKGWELDRVVLLCVPAEVLTARALGRRRADDKEEVIRERLRVYQEQTEPLVSRYGELGLLERIDGDAAVEKVTTDILTSLR